MKRIIITIFLSFFSIALILAQGSLRKEHFNLNESVAIQGYDPVAYYSKSKAVKGIKVLSVFHEGVVYYFSTIENKDAFKKNAAKYEPVYGGWCAYAMGATGEKVPIDPATFKIINGKLYLFYNKFFNNTLKDWNKDEANLKTKADTNWSKIFH